MTRRRKAFVFVLLLALAFVAVLGVTAIAVWRAAHTDDASTTTDTDVIIVLGAAQYQGEPSPVFIGRLEHAKLLFDDGRAPMIVVLGAGQPGDRTTEAASGREYLIAQGVPEASVVAQPEGTTTLESLEAAASFMRERDLTSAFLVSDPWHNLRLKRMAADVGIDGYASATWQSAAVSHETRGEGYFREVLAYIYYRLGGR